MATELYDIAYSVMPPRSLFDDQVNRNAFVKVASTFPKLPRPHDTRVMCIADFGSGLGLNSYVVFNKLIEETRKRDAHMEYQIYLIDVPEQDFTNVFRLMNSHPLSPVIKHQGVYTAAVGCNFYKRCLPMDTVEFGAAYNCLNWLSKLPETKEKGFFIDERVHKRMHGIFARQWQSDFRDFLKHRADELVSNGRLAITLFTNREIGKIASLMAVNQVLENMTADGIILREEAEQLVLPLFLPTMNMIQDILKEFHQIYRVDVLEEVPNEFVTDDTFDLTENMMGTQETRSPKLEKEKLISEEKIPFVETSQDQSGDEASNKYAELACRSIKSGLGPYLLRHLGEHRSLGDRIRLIEDIFENVRVLLNANPQPLVAHTANIVLCRAPKAHTTEE